MSVTIHPSPTDTLVTAEIERWRNVPVAVAVDVSVGDCQVDPKIRPLMPPGRQPRLFARAVTARVTAPDFGAVLHAVDRVGPGQVLLIDSGGDASTAMIGEILSGQLRRRGGCGVVIDGAIRDVATLAEWSDFSAFARSITPRGPASMKTGDVNGPVRIGGLIVQPGDLIIGDDDGLAALSPDAVRRHIAAAEKKLALEERWQASLAEGKSVGETFGL